MKRFDRFLHAAMAASIVLSLATLAFAANVIPTPIVGPTETGENSLGAQQVTDFARIKIGSCAVTTTGAEPNFTAVACNGASGSVTTNANVTVAAVGGKDTVTITDTKIQAGDFVQCTLDTTGAAAGQAIFTISNLTVTSPAAPLKVYFLVMTQGNPN